MDFVRLRFEAQQCYLRAVRTRDPTEVARLHALGDRLSALADQAEPSPDWLAKNGSAQAPHPQRSRPDRRCERMPCSAHAD